MFQVAPPRAQPRARRSRALNRHSLRRASLLAALALSLASATLTSTAVYNGNASVPSNTLTTATLAPPTGLTATTSGSDVALSWTATPSTYATGYTIARGTTSSGPFTPIGTTTGRTTTTYTDTGAGATAYWYVVAATANNWTSGTISSAYTPATTAKFPGQYADAPTAVANTSTTWGSSPGAATPNGYFADATRLYATSNSGIFTIPLSAAGSFTQLATLANARGLVFARSVLYISTTDGTIYSINTSTGALTLKLSNMGAVNGLAFDGTYLYSTDGNASAPVVHKITINGDGSLTDQGAFWTGLSAAGDIVSDSNGTLYVSAASGNVLKRTAAGTVTTINIGGGAVNGLEGAADGAVYVVLSGLGIKRIDGTTGTVTTLITSYSLGAGPLATDGRYLYTGNSTTFRVG